MRTRSTGCRPIGASTTPPPVITPDADGFVLALDFARLDGAHQRRVRFERARDDHQAARVLVEPMHDARPRHLRELRVEVQQRVLQRAGRVAGAWMHDQPGGLVDHEDVAVLVDDVQLDLLRRDRRDRFGERGADFEPARRPEPCPWAAASHRRRAPGRPRSIP